jgi:hypothetical protein
VLHAGRVLPRVRPFQIWIGDPVRPADGTQVPVVARADLVVLGDVVPMEIPPCAAVCPEIERNVRLRELEIRILVVEIFQFELSNGSGRPLDRHPCKAQKRCHAARTYS